MRIFFFTIILATFLHFGTGEAAVVLQQHTLTPAVPEIRLAVCLTGSSPVDIRITEHEYTIEIQIYGKSAPIAGLLRLKSGRYTFCQAHLRDKNREELIGLGLTGPLNELTDIFIIGIDGNNEIVPLDLAKNYIHNLVSPKLEQEGAKLIIPFFFTSRGSIKVSWDERRQTFQLIEDRH